MILYAENQQLIHQFSSLVFANQIIEKTSVNIGQEIIYCQQPIKEFRHIQHHFALDNLFLTR